MKGNPNLEKSVEVHLDQVRAFYHSDFPKLFKSMPSRKADCGLSHAFPWEVKEAFALGSSADGDREGSEKRCG